MRMRRLGHALRGHIQRGGVIAYPTESCFGLGCNPLDPQGLKAILRLKGRPQRKGMIVVAASLDQVRPLLRPLSGADEAKLMHYWPGPYTFLLPAARRVLPLLRGKHPTLAVRITAHPATVALCRSLGPLVSTSANRSGKPSIRDARNCRRQFGQAVQVITGRVGRARKPSTIIDFASGRVLRG